MVGTAANSVTTTLAVERRDIVLCIWGLRWKEKCEHACTVYELQEASNSEGQWQSRTHFLTHRAGVELVTEKLC